MHGESPVGHSLLILRKKVEDAEGNAAVVARQGMDGTTGYPAGITLGYEIFPSVDGDAQCSADRYHQLDAVMAMQG